jgi:hypothetical protein
VTAPLAAYAPLPVQGADAADAATLAAYVRDGIVSTLGNGREKTRRTFVYGPGGAVVGEKDTRFAVDYVSRLRAGAVQNDNLPDGGPFEAFFPGRFAPKNAEALSHPLETSGWTTPGADATKPMAWPDALHVEAYGYANAWWIDPALLRLLPQATDTRPGYFAVDGNGALDCEILLSFAPQTSYLIGLMMSATTMLACLAILLVAPIFGKRRERSHA